MVAIYQPGETIRIGRPRQGVSLRGGGGCYVQKAWLELLSSQTLYSGSGSTDWIGRAVLVDKNGVWIMVYRVGLQHAYDAASVVHIRFSTDQGLSWSAADTFTNGAAVTGAPFNGHSTNDATDPYIMLAPNGDLLIHIGESNNADATKGTYQYRSTNGGASWSDEGQINSDDDFGACQDHCIVGTTIYMPTVSSAWVSPIASHLYKSEDNGATWVKVSEITTTAENTSEAGIVYLGNNTLLTILRDGVNAKTYKRVSTDLGATWGSLVDVTAQLYVLQRARMAIYSQEPNRIYLWGRDTFANSYTAIYYSDDGGATWSFRYRPDSNAYGDAGYASMLRRKNGDFYMLSYAGASQAVASIVEYVMRGAGASLTLAVSKDTTIVSNSANNNYGIGSDLNAGENNNTTGRVWRSFIRFDASSVPSNATVLLAVMRLYFVSDLSSTSRAVQAYRMKRSWAEGSGNGSATADGATWNKYDGVNDWTAAGGFDAADCEQTGIGTVTMLEAPLARFYEWYLDPAAVQDWIDGNIVNNGLMLKADVELNDNYAFASSQHVTAANRPQLVVMYK